MTIAIKPVTNSKEEKAKLGGDYTALAVDDGSAAPVPKPNKVVVIFQRQKRRAGGASPPPSLSGVRRVTGALLALSICVLCFCLAKILCDYANRKSQSGMYRGFCRIPYSRSLRNSMISGPLSNVNENGDHDIEASTYDDVLLTDRHSLKPLPNGELELDYELDLEFETHEVFTMPELSKGRYLHDFKFNRTAIIDPEGERCFVMALDPVEVPKPRNMFDILRHLRDGSYDLDVEEVRHDTRVVLPAVNDLQQFGMYISAACESYTTYKLEPAAEAEGIVVEAGSVVQTGSVIVKRSAGDFVQTFKEFTGKNVLTYNILNIGDI